MQDNTLPIPTFYEMPSYVPIAKRTVKKEKPPIDPHITCGSDHHYQQMMSYFDVDTFEQVGVLEGEYALIGDCNLLVDRDGVVVRSASDSKDAASLQAISHLCRSEQFIEAANKIIMFWDKIPILESPAILSDIYIQNYFHFSLEMAPRIRHFQAASPEKIVVGASALRLPFQTSLLSRAGAGYGFVPAPQALRVRNPVLAHDSMSDSGVRWLRQIGPTAKRGHRRIYIRRGSHSTRTVSGGGLHESAEVMSVLKDLNFEIIEFGTEKTVEAQVAMLDGASLILATHGAALTNIVYLDGGVSILEIIGTRTPRAFFMHICNICNLHYSAIITESYNDGLDILVDPDQLRENILKMVSFI